MIVDHTMCLKLELHDRSSSWSKKQHPASVFNGFCCVVDYDLSYFDAQCLIVGSLLVRA